MNEKDGEQKTAKEGLGGKQKREVGGKVVCQQRSRNCLRTHNK
jgi:hypothetical protein